MKILLTAINAKYIHSNPAVHILKAYVREYADAIEVVEYTINQQPDDILSDIYRRKPDVLAFSCYIWNWKMVKTLLPELPKILPDVKIWLGGPEVTYDAMARLEKYPFLSGIMVGEGEETFRELAAYYCNGEKKLTEIAGICIPGDGYTEERKPIDMDKVPFFYEDGMEAFEHKILYYETSRGCPFQCSYCLSSIDKKVRLRSLELVEKELQFFLDHKVAQVKFVDRTFNCNHKHALGIWNYIQRHDNGVTNFHFEITADLLNEEELELLAKMRPGLVQLEIGVQSTNENTIKEIRRAMDLEKLKEIVARIHAMRNIHQHLDLIAGLPYEDYDSFVNSFNEVYAMQPDQLQMGFLKVLKGSYMDTQAENYGIAYQSNPPYEVLFSKWLSYDDVLRLKKVEEMVELYYNSNQFVNTISVLERAFDSPYRMFDKLGDYYETHGYYVNKPARSYRYDVLLAFAVEQDAKNEELYRELLTYDMYLRENCKSRPTFSKNLTPYKEELRNRQSDRRMHVEVFYYPVWDAKVGDELPRMEKPAYIAFDYENRDPLSHNAAIMEL